MDPKDRIRVKDIYKFMNSEKERRGCENCGKHFPYYVLDFSHRNCSTKDRTNGRSNRDNIKTMTAALSLLENCDILCVVCHRIKTKQDKDYLHNAPKSVKGQIGNSKPTMYRKIRRRKLKSKEFINKAKDGSCVDCGQKFPPIAMDFDHIEKKKIAISEMVRMAATINTISEEIAKCELVCANCHRERTQKQKLLKT